MDSPHTIDQSEAWRFDDREREMMENVGFAFDIPKPNGETAHAPETAAEPDAPSNPAENVVAEIRAHLAATTSPHTNGQLLPGDEEVIRRILDRHYPQVTSDSRQIRLTFGDACELTHAFIEAISDPVVAAYQARFRAARDFVLSLQR